MSTRIPTYVEVDMKSFIPDFIEEGVPKSHLTSKMARWFKFASDEAFKSNFRTAMVGCVVVYKNHIIGRGHNQLKTDPYQKKYNQYRGWVNYPNYNGHTIHAEIDALKNIPYPIAIQVDWKKVEVFVYRIGMGLDNYSGLALPCEACAKAISDRGIRNVYYTTGNEDKPFGHCDL